jgi:hypothetical protein
VDIEQATAIINGGLTEGYRIVSVCVPTRGVRVITKDDMTFRVEQLGGSIPPKWLPLSSHKGDAVWDAYGVALQDAVTKQVRLREKIKLAQHEQKMADIKARSAAGL